eukprot:TRINITY_DN6293_c0_g1_i2.p1 TRINITY_DN6293_c0_g1~~TRINITY_DN6293_c0_g1_i2.p1  ORF type:complete len:300 (-),score=46.14 TRINITY_DN6293_c0_g1_i2:82-981(-)
MFRSTVVVLCWVVILCTARKVTVSDFLDNGVIRVGIDENHGGSITYIAQSGTDFNVINSHDEGREVQQSYYSGPVPYRGGSFMGNPWPWNPIGAGDMFGHSGAILNQTNDGTTLYVKSRPLQWALNDCVCNCTFESWLTLDGTAVRVRNRLVTFRADKTNYGAHTQELPAVYTIGQLYRLMTYQGSAPFTNAPLTNVDYPIPGPPWTSWQATENWAALVTTNNWGLGVMNLNTTTIAGGFHGKQGQGGPSDDNTGYIAPNANVDLLSDGTYEYEYALILGNLSDIRAYVYQHHPQANAN